MTEVEMEEEIKKYGSKEVVKAAIMIALTSDREEEKKLKDQLAKKGADFGHLHQLTRVVVVACDVDEQGFLEAQRCLFGVGEGHQAFQGAGDVACLDFSAGQVQHHQCLIVEVGQPFGIGAHQKDFGVLAHGIPLRR